LLMSSLGPFVFLGWRFPLSAASTNRPYHGTCDNFD
jgi:hypothetical protein